MESFSLAPMPLVIQAFKSGKPVIMVDDSDRENEGDLVLAAEFANAQNIAFMMNAARGLICVSLSQELAQKLEMPLQVINNNSPYQTAFTVSIDHKKVAHYGVQADARAFTIKSLVAADVDADDFVSPGHVFPLIANPAGVLGRRGQTEGSFDLARIAGLQPAGVICEILNPDGSMTRGQDLAEFANKHQLCITSVEEVMRYRVQHEILLRLVSTTMQDSDYGQVQVAVFADDATSKEHMAVIYGDLKKNQGQPTLVRVHSECLTGDVFTSRRCDCGEQLKKSMQQIVSVGFGIVIYLRQEGRGIGLINKMRAYELQDHGRDTIEANLELGLPADDRDFLVAAKVLQHFKINQIKLMTNNPEKIGALEANGIQICERVVLQTGADPFCDKYLNTKREKLGHLL